MDKATLTDGFFKIHKASESKLRRFAFIGVMTIAFLTLAALNLRTELSSTTSSDVLAEQDDVIEVFEESIQFTSNETS